MSVDFVSSDFELHEIDDVREYFFGHLNGRLVQKPSTLFDAILGKVHNALNEAAARNRFSIDHSNYLARKCRKEPNLGPSSLSSNPIDLVNDVAKAISDAKSGDWVSAAADSIEVAKDIVDIAKDVGEAVIDSRVKAVEGDYADNSEVGFQ